MRAARGTARVATALGAIGLALVGPGCFAQHGPGDAGAGDAGHDARVPPDAARLDAARADASPDVAPDAGSDAGSGAGSDAGSDSGSDAGADVSLDAAACPVGTMATAAGCLATTPIAPCDVPGNVLHLEGDAWVFTGATTVDDTAGSFDVSAVAAPLWMPPPEPNTVEAEVTLRGTDRRRYYRLELSTAGTDRALEPGAFDEAMRYPFSITDGRNGLTLSSTGRGCNQSSGRFDVHRVVLAGTAVREILVSFDFYCERRDLVRGCLHYVEP